MNRINRLLPLLILLWLPFSIGAQNSSFRIDVESVTLPTLIDVLEKDFDVNFSYDSDLLSDQVFFLSTNTNDLGDILDEISAIYPVEYQLLKDHSILLRNRLSQEDSILNDYSVTLKIIDAVSLQPLELAAVGILGTSKGSYSDKDGSLNLSLSTDPQNTLLEVHLMGYQSKKVSLRDIEDFTITLDILPFDIEEVMIEDRSDIVSINNSDLSVTLRTNHIASLASGVLGQDVLRQVQLLPGVAAFNDKSSGLMIRGSGEEASLIMMDDIPIYNPSHYYGLFSSINPTYASSFTLYKNNLPVAYDGKTAGMLQVKGPTSDSLNATIGSIDINLLSISGTVQVPISQRLVLSVGGRSTYQNVSDTDFFDLFKNEDPKASSIENFNFTSRNELLSSVPDFKFFDLNGQLSYHWKKGELSLSYFQSSDDLEDTFSNEFQTRRERVLITNTEGYSNIEAWQNRGLNAKLESKLFDNLNVSSLLYYSNYNSYSSLDVSLERDLINRTNLFSYQNIRENDVSDLGFKSSLLFDNKTTKWQVGLDVVSHEVRARATENDEPFFNRDNTKFESSLFASYTPIYKDNLEVEIGLRGTVYNNKIYASPRINLNYSFSPQFSFKSSVGRHNQYVRQLSLENTFGRSIEFWTLANENIAVGISDQIMLGGTYKLGRVSFDIETYFKKRYNLIELALFNPRFNETAILPLLSNGGGNEYRLFTGVGQTLGVDIMASYTLPRYSGWLSYTLSKSTINYDQILRGTSFPTQDDRRHQLKFINEYRISDFTLGATFVYASGRPYTDLNKVSNNNRDQQRPEDRISRLPAYIRTDVGLSYQIDIGDSSVELGFSIYNLFNRSNVNYVQYLFSIPSNSQQDPNRNMNSLLGAESNLLNRTTNLNLKYSF